MLKIVAGSKQVRVRCVEITVFRKKTWGNRALLRKALRAYRVVDPNTGCWLWKGFRKYYYPAITIEGKQIRATVAALWAWKGVRLKGRQIVAAHKCDTPHCFRPSHLFSASHSQNATDAQRKGRRIKSGDQPCCKHGHEFTKTNTYIKRNGTRMCKQCHALSERRRRKRWQHAQDRGWL